MRITLCWLATELPQQKLQKQKGISDCRVCVADELQTKWAEQTVLSYIHMHVLGGRARDMALQV